MLEDVCRLYANSTLLYKGLEQFQDLVSAEGEGDGNFSTLVFWDQFPVDNKD